MISPVADEESPASPEQPPMHSSAAVIATRRAATWRFRFRCGISRSKVLARF